MSTWLSPFEVVVVSAALDHPVLVESPVQRGIGVALYAIGARGAYADDLRLFRRERLEVRLKWVPISGHEATGGMAVTAEQQMADFVCHGVAERAVELREVLQRCLANAVS